MLEHLNIHASYTTANLCYVKFNSVSYYYFSVFILSFPEKYIDDFMKVAFDKGLTSSGQYIFIHLTFGAGLNHTSTQDDIFSSLLEVGPVSTTYSKFENDCKNFLKPANLSVPLINQVKDYSC